MEMNSVHIMIQKIRHQPASKIDPAFAEELIQDLILQDRYLTALYYLPNISWHTVRENPSIYPTQSEVQRRAFDAVKAGKDVYLVLKQIYPEYKVPDTTANPTPEAVSNGNIAKKV